MDDNKYTFYLIAAKFNLIILFDQNWKIITIQFVQYELILIADVKEEISANKRLKFWTNIFTPTSVIRIRVRKPKKSLHENVELLWARYHIYYFYTRIITQ